MTDSSDDLMTVEGWYMRRNGLIAAAEFTDQVFSLAFDQCEIDSYEIMEIGERLGLLEQVAFDPKIHHGDIDADEGDMIYIRTAKAKALRAEKPSF